MKQNGLLQQSRNESTFETGLSSYEIAATYEAKPALCKILAHNICVLIQSMFELDVKPNFWREV
jgi:hypothetical protein